MSARPMVSEAHHPWKNNGRSAWQRCMQLYPTDRYPSAYPGAQPSLLESVVHDRGDLVRADSSQPGTIEFLRSRGFGVVPARKGPGSVREGIQFLQGYQLVVDPTCEQMRNELRLYSWPTDRLTGMVIAGVNPIDSHNHLIDCARYACDDLIIDAPLEDDDSGVLLLPTWKIQNQRVPPPLPRHRDDGVNMNDLLRSIPRPRFPQPPG